MNIQGQEVRAINKGIAVAGSMYTDYYKLIEELPEKGMLSPILEVTKTFGGCVMNTIINLRKIDPSMPLYAYGGVGKDDNGDYLIKVLKDNNINFSGVIQYENESTSFTDAFVLKSTKERTFFSLNGATNVFSYDDIDFESLEASIFHIGYALMLGALDKEEKEYGTVMARTLARVQEKGIKTSMDLVSIDDDRFEKVVHASLPYCNYLIVNEIEAGKTANLSPYDSNGNISEDNLRGICGVIFEKGVKDLVVIHAPLGGWAMTVGGAFYHVPSLRLPEGYIRGSVGAGDAFAAGMLYSLYKEHPVDVCLRNANIAAAFSLGGIDSSSGMKEYKEFEGFYQNYKAE